MLAQQMQCALLRGDCLALAAFDVWKAFGQLARPVLYVLMPKAGWPVKPACAFVRLVERMAARSSFVGFS
eukprot:4655045-Alexandrium_andersonii.AAC.1